VPCPHAVIKGRIPCPHPSSQGLHAVCGTQGQQAPSFGQAPASQKA
jgi:hypothetical protein